MRQAVELKGRPASDGIFAGPVFFLEDASAKRRVAGDAETETDAFDAAVAAAIAGLTVLVITAQGDGADMLSFQIALLEDDALLGPARALIAQGKPADEAWRKTVDAEIVGYELSDDDYFRARAADLKLRMMGIRGLFHHVEADRGDERARLLLVPPAFAHAPSVLPGCNRARGSRT